jgi:hypothetical protein
MNTQVVATVPTETYPTVRASVEAYVNFRASLSTGPDRAFTGEQLREYVLNSVFVGAPVAPATVDRALRVLRQAGKINYLVLNRGKSLYKALPVMIEAVNASDYEPAQE